MELKEYRLVWHDEFDYEGRPDPRKWNYDVGNRKWANNELQAYTDRAANVEVRDGKLLMRALKERDGEREYTSVRMTTWERQSWQYGYFEIRAKLPSGRGSWPAFWFLADDIRRGISVGSLFLAGYLPGALLAVSLMIGSYIISVKRLSLSVSFVT